MTSATPGFLAHAFRGQTWRIIETCVAGGAVGLSITFAQRKMSEIDISLRSVLLPTSWLSNHAAMPWIHRSRRSASC